MSEWKPINTAPKDGSWILGFDPTISESEVDPQGVVIVRWCDSDGEEGVMWHWADAVCGELVEPTHWMPIPPPPKAN